MDEHDPHVTHLGQGRSQEKLERDAKATKALLVVFCLLAVPAVLYGAWRFFLTAANAWMNM